MHPFGWGTLTLERLPVGFYTRIYFIINWHTVRLPFRPSVSPFRFFLSCDMLGIVRYNLPDVDIQLNTWLDLRDQAKKCRDVISNNVLF